MRKASNAFRRLDHVFAAIDHGSLRRAAKALRTRESCVSRNVVALEQLLDMQLFDRNAHGVQLTAEGRAWTAAVRTHYESLQDALTERECGNKDVTTIRVGLSALIGRTFLMHLIDRFGELHPDVTLAIEDIRSEQALAAIRRRRLDIVFSHGLEPTALCQSEVFGQERLFVLLPANHPLAERTAIAWADLAGTYLLVTGGPEGSAPHLDLLARIAAGGPTVQICRASEATVIFQVQLGLGVTLAGESFARAVTIESTVWKPIEGRDSISPIKAAWLESNPKRALLRLVGTARNLATRLRK